MLINSTSFFWSHWTAWKVLGVAHQKITRWRPLYFGCVLVFNLLITVGYPLHLGMSALRTGSLTDDVLNMTIFTTCLACSFKIGIYAYNFDKVEKMEQLLKKLDARVKSQAEMEIFSQIKRQLRAILYLFLGIFLPIAVFAELAFVFHDGRGLMYPARFPFDWQHNTLNYYMANGYQIFGLSYQLLQNYVNDCFPAVMLCLISAHIKMLYIRFEQLGQDGAADAEAQQQLEDCITDHKILLELFRTIESFMSLPMFIQFTVLAMNVCISMAALFFFVSEPMERSYFFFYAMGIPLQVLPTCVYGTDNEYWFGKLQYAAFSCNWIAQSRDFKQKLMLFVERSLKVNTAMAGNMVRIHMGTFFTTLKFAYSLFTILIRMQK